jgi:signal transduction histidine kinase/CheY-like chemotaxis protein
MTRLGAFQYFRYLSLIVVAGFGGLALEHSYLNLRWLALVDLMGGLLLLLIRRWVLRAGDASRMVPGAHLVSSLCLLVLLGHALATGQNQSVAAWFMPVLPILAAFIGGTRVACIWAVISILAVLGLWASESIIHIPPNLLASPGARAMARIALIGIATAFGLTARIVSERHTYALVQSLLAEQAAKRMAEKARQATEKAYRAKSDFMATISHEVRTPLNSVVGLTSLLLDLPQDEKARQYLEQSRKSGEMLLHLVNDILDYAKLEAGQLKLEQRAFDPHQVAEETLAIVEPQATGKGLTLTLDIDAPHSLRGDPDRLRQILLNLLGNAVKFTARGEIRLRCQQLTEPGPRTWLCFEIEDKGIGIDTAVAADLFEPFTQADASTTRRYGGTGLGLAICQNLTDLMGGEIGFDSALDEGTTFWVKLPFDPPPGASRAVPDHVPLAAAVAESREAPALHVLLAEDNPVNQFVAVEMLRRLGCEVTLAQNGQQALEAAGKQPFDLIFMDCDMPVLDGYDATRAIRAEQATRHVPIIALTASAFDGERTRCLEAGMDDFLAKPVRLSDFDACIRTWRPPAPPAG